MIRPAKKKCRMMGETLCFLNFDETPEDHTRYIESVRKIDPHLDEDLAEKLWQELSRTRERLSDWLKRSSVNAQWFEQNPLEALGAAPIGFHKEPLKELKRLSGIVTDQLKEGGSL